MVLLSELKQNNMFWGVSLDGGKRYTQIVETSFHISMAALEQSTDELPKGKRSVSLWIQHEKAEFLLCTLEHNRIMQQPLDLNFTEGEEITLFTTGCNGSIHLSGYLMDEPDIENEMPEMSEEEMSDEEEDSEAEVPELLPAEDDSLIIHGTGKKRKMLEAQTKKKRQKVVVQDEGLDFDSDDDEEDDADYTIEDEDDNDLSEDDSDDDEDDDDDDDDDSDLDDTFDEDGEEDDDSEVEEKVVLQKDKKNKTPKKSIEPVITPNKSSLTPKRSSETPKTPNINGTPAESESSKKKKKKKNKDNNTSINTPSQSEKKSKNETPQKPNTPNRRVLAEGLIVEDIKVGNGPPAKSSKMVQMYYVGKLSNGKQFDSCTGGKPFKFRLGKQEVIKGWDVGVQGMKVGGKRRLIVPPKLGYGNHKQGPIPANSTLVFDVELKSVS
ncbi:hypothetical protein SNE40_011420 [Patella caerulea]|uniref:FK506-binding protein n=1 Tax=Patella caerulea TaxID=87958 RepID=A0AAN8PLM1_PATCE